MNIDNTIQASINILPKIPIKGIYYIGQYGTSGYATAAKGYLYHYFVNDLPITWDPLYFDNSKLSDTDPYDVVVKSLINRQLPDYDMVIMHSTPDLWPKFWNEKSNILKNKIVNGYCTWETNRLPKDWVKCINGYVNEVWCPSTYNKSVFEDSGITKPIRVVPHIFLPQQLISKDNIIINDTKTGNIIKSDGTFTFYSIGEFNARKGIDDLIKCFCQAFDNTSNVRLILKVHYKNYTPDNKRKCEEMIYDISSAYPKHAPIICLTDRMTSKEILALHSIGDCYVSLTRSEGFGLTIFDAFNYGKKVIATGYSGHIDFLGLNYPGLVKYKLKNVSGMREFSANYSEDQIWAYPELDHVIELMKLNYENKL